ncbi:hypothetical protein K492DRAFT_57637 [Lichtheimia hyalospora FSU 10163]|nr:hypothetical protein K492DRAFT_57637 [Lichtheimia hyalospora FSU 10163]
MSYMIWKRKSPGISGGTISCINRFTWCKHTLSLCSILLAETWFYSLTQHRTQTRG